VAVPARRTRIAFGVTPVSGEPLYTDWVNVTSYVRSITTRVGRSEDLDRAEAATAIIELDNQDGRFTPENSAGAYYPNVRPFAQVEIAWIADDAKFPFTLGSATLGDSTGDDAAILYDTAPASSSVFRGLVEKWTPTWWNPKGGTCLVEVVDLFRYLQFSDLTGAAYAQQTVGARISAVLTDIGNPFPTDIDSAGLTIAAETPTGNALDYMRDIAQQDGGIFYSRGDGKIAFKSRATLRGAATFRTVQATLGDQAGQFRYLDLRQSQDEQLVFNKITGKTSGGTAITAQENATSQNRYLKRVKDLGTTKIVAASDVESRAAVELADKSSPRLRVDALSYELLDSSLDATSLVALDLMYRVKVVRTPDQGAAISQEYIVQGIDHTVGISSWRMDFRVSSAPSARMELGVATLGETAVL
jgi:hypothetical protein